MLRMFELGAGYKVVGSGFCCEIQTDANNALASKNAL